MNKSFEQKFLRQFGKCLILEFSGVFVHIGHSKRIQGHIITFIDSLLESNVLRYLFSITIEMIRIRFSRIDTILLIIFLKSSIWLVLCLQWCSFPNMETWTITVFEFKRGVGGPNCYTGVVDWRHHPIYLIILLFYQLL